MLLLGLLACGSGTPPREPEAGEVRWSTATPIVDPGEMVFISGANFTMGHPDQAMGPYGNSWKSNELPPHAVTISGFYLDADEVTVEAWVSFLNTQRDGVPELEVHHHPLQAVEWASGAFQALPGSEDKPIAMVNWFDAVTYCAWAGKRLPTEAEWERAAKGTEEEDKGFPYGRDRPTCDEAVFFTNLGLCESGPAVVGSRSPAGDTSDGVRDMAGNVAEWVWDRYGTYSGDEQVDPHGPSEGERRVLRGGGYRDTSDGVRTMARLGVSPYSRSEGVGFRCAY
jgi:formylglycine-generating enzyme required for sulfatase activity